MRTLILLDKFEPYLLEENRQQNPRHMKCTKHGIQRKQGSAHTEKIHIRMQLSVSKVTLEWGMQNFAPRNFCPKFGKNHRTN